MHQYGIMQHWQYIFVLAFCVSYGAGWYEFNGSGGSILHPNNYNHPWLVGIYWFSGIQFCIPTITPIPQVHGRMYNFLRIRD